MCEHFFVLIDVVGAGVVLATLAVLVAGRPRRRPEPDEHAEFFDRRDG